MSSSQPNPDRRGFLRRCTHAGVYLAARPVRVLEAAALVATAGGLASFRIEARRVPLWHPASSGFNSDQNGLTVRRALDGAQVREIVLRGSAARLWCLCGGRHTEADLVRILAQENNTSRRRARHEVTSFLRDLYQHELLIALEETEPRATSIEVECPSGRGEAVWQQHMS